MSFDDSCEDSLQEAAWSHPIGDRRPLQDTNIFRLTCSSVKCHQEENKEKRKDFHGRGLESQVTAEKGDQDIG